MAYIYDLADTWNSSGTVFTAIKMNVTDTASSVNSMLMDLQNSGVSRFSVRRDGLMAARHGQFVDQADVGLGFAVSSSGGISIGGTTGSINFTSTNNAGSAADLTIRRDAANTLAQRNGTAAQAFNIYNTYTDASNYERGFMRWSANTLQIGTDKLGTGTARTLVFQTDGTTRMTLATAGGATIRENLAITNGFGTQVGVVAGFGGVQVLSLGLVTGLDAGASTDVFLVKESAGVLSQRSATTAQTSRLYGTYTDASNYRRLTNTMSTAGVAEIKPEGAGTGASGNVLHISGLPTSNPGAGILWNDAGTVKVGT